MNPLSTPKSCLSVALVALSSLATAQLPKHTAVVGTTAVFSKSPGTTGVFSVTLRTSTSPGGKITRLSNLPKELTVTSGKPSDFGGAFSVLYRPSDGVLFVGDGAGPGGWCHVHILKVAGTVVSSSRKVRIGQVTSTPGNARAIAMALLPDGRIAIVGGPFVAGPLISSPIGIFDDRPSIPTVTPIKLSYNPGPFLGAITIAPDGKTAYVINQRSFPNPPPSKLFSIDISRSTRVTPVLLHTWLKCLIPQMRMGPDGVIHATCYEPSGSNPATPSIEQIRVTPTTAVVKSIPVSQKTAIVGPVLESATGRYVFVSTDFGTHTNNNSVLMSDVLGKLTVLTGPPTGGWGVPWAIEINNTFETYGTGSAGANSYSIAEFPNPGGLPEVVANSKFSLTVQSTPGAPSLSFLLLGLGRADRQLLGIRLLIDLSQPNFLFPMSTAKSAVFPLPIPNAASIRGARIYAQSAHADAGGRLATSNGVSITVQ